ncbi:MAG TPA: lasso peptide biosynthesis B2 protein [Solirubrobacteraceae bacterium]|jgi:hypothetical protein
MSPTITRGSSVAKLRRLSWSDRAVLVEAVACLALARAAVRALPFRVLAARLGARDGDSGGDVRSAEARRVAWMIGAAAPRTPWRSKCLEQAIAGKLMLRRRGVPSTMYLGVKRDPFEAHAWLRAGGATVLGGAGAERFAVLASFGESAPGSPK